jgi:hypothetical protein
MRSFYLDKNGNSREGNIIIFLECTIDNHIQIAENKISIEQLYNGKEVWIIVNDNEILNPDIDYERISKLSKQNYKLVIQSIITLCAFLESLINEIGLIDLGSKYFKENIDSLSITAKWEIVLKIVYGKSINKSDKYNEDLKKLITARNSLVHYKTKVANLDNDKDLDYFEQILTSTINTLPNLFKDLEIINRKKNVISMADIKSQFQRIR